MTAVRGEFYVGISGGGTHPAIDRTSAHVVSPTVSTPDHPGAIRSGLVIDADHLQEAQTITRRRRVPDPDGGPAATRTVLRVEVLLGETAHRARSTLHRLDARLAHPHPARSVRFLGTLDGLKRLISDIRVTDVADGVILDLLDPRQRHIVRDAVPTYRTEAGKSEATLATG